MTNSFYIYSFPRSGSHYLQALLRSRLQANVRRSHSLADYSQDQHLVSVVRSPLEAITSDAVIGMSYRGYDPETVLPKVVDTLTRSYIKVLTDIYEQSSIIIDFEDLVSRPDDVANYISSMVGTEIVNQGEEIIINAQTITNGSPDFCPSAKELPLYETISNLMSVAGVSERAYEVYNLALSKAIAIDTQI